MLGAEVCSNIIRKAKKAEIAYCKFLTVKDTIQMADKPAGIYIAKNAQEILFQHLQEMGCNQERVVTILWQNQISLKNKFVYYGKRLRNEYCITQFPENFPYLKEELTGSLFFLIEKNTEEYDAYVIEDEREIRDVLESFFLSPIETDRVLKKKITQPFALEKFAMNDFLKSLKGEFPKQEALCEGARKIYYEVYNLEKEEIKQPDKLYLSWIKMEKRLFSYIENEFYLRLIEKKVDSLTSYLEVAEEMIQKRKTRIVESLLNHLKELFLRNGKNVRMEKAEETMIGDALLYTVLPKKSEKTEQQKECILNIKILCKDSWKQDLKKSMVDQKVYLFTLQQGLSLKVLLEMKKAGIILIMPQKYIDCYPSTQRSMIWSIAEYLDSIEKILNQRL